MLPGFTLLTEFNKGLWENQEPETYSETVDDDQESEQESNS